MEPKEDRRVQYTKLFLRNALLELMKEKPIGKITTTELCRQADVNRNTFYAHYSAPEDLLREIETELYTDIMNCVSVFSGNTLNLEAICRAIKEHADLCSVLLSNHGDLEFLPRLLSSARDFTIEEWKPQAPQATEQELEIFFNYCANGSVAVIREWVMSGMTMPHEQIAKILEDVNTSVMSALCGQKEPEKKNIFFRS